MKASAAGRTVILGMLALSASSSAADEASMRFRDVTALSGIDLVTRSGGEPSTEILEVNGSGLALFDYDDDGDLDLFVANGATMDAPERGPGSRLYANDGRGTFTDITANAGLTIRRWAMGAAIGDYDADGDDDLYVTCYGPNVLLRNDRDGARRRFVDVSSEAGVDDPRFGTSAAFGDIDADGDLDLYVANYLEFDIEHPPAREGRLFKGTSVFVGPLGLKAQGDVLYENRSDGRFRDATAARGCAVSKPGYGLGVVILDLDGDGRQDIFVGNDSTANHHFANRGDGRFTELGALSGLAADFDGREQATMGIAVGDVSGNGLPDLFSTNFSGDTNTLHVNLGRGLFEDRTSQYGLAAVSRPFLSWGAGFHDFDSDGDEDLFVASGHIYPQASRRTMDSDYRQPVLLFERAADRFRRVANAGELLERRYVARAAAFGDLDDDGDVDIVMTSLNEKVRVFENVSARGNVAVVELRGKPGNTRALGARVELEAGDRTQHRWIHGGSYISVDSPAAHFGLGAEAPEKVSVRVRWPDGHVTRHDDLEANRRITIVERDGSASVRRLAGRAGG